MREHRNTDLTVFRRLLVFQSRRLVSFTFQCFVCDWSLSACASLATRHPASLMCAPSLSELRPVQGRVVLSLKCGLRATITCSGFSGVDTKSCQTAEAAEAIWGARGGGWSWGAALMTVFPTKQRHTRFHNVLLGKCAFSHLWTH